MSHTAPCLPVVIPTQRPLMATLTEPWHHLRSLVEAVLARRRARALEQELLGPDGLSPQMLRDVGFNAWQVEHAETARARQVERWLW